MSEQWPLRQDPESPVIFAQSLLEDIEALAFVVLDDDDDWFISDGSEFSDDMEVNRAQFVTLPLHDALERIPELVALAALPTGMAADWDPDRRTWLLSSVADSDDEAEDEEIRQTRIAAWPHPGSPVTEVQVSSDLAEIATATGAPKPAVRQVVREQDGAWLFVSFEVPEAEEFEVEMLELEHVVRLYPDVVGVLAAAAGQVYDRADRASAWELVEG